jgi:hypothetical protein
MNILPLHPVADASVLYSGYDAFCSHIGGTNGTVVTATVEEIALPETTLIWQESFALSATVFAVTVHCAPFGIIVAMSGSSIVQL